MGSMEEKPHAVCIPYPSHSHMKGMLKLAKLLHSRGIHITFVNTEFNHKRLLESGGPTSLDGLPDFTFETIPDGLPPADVDTPQRQSFMWKSTHENFLVPFVELLNKLNDGASKYKPPVTCIIADGFMTFALDAGEQLGLPVVLLWTFAACALMGFYQFQTLMEKGLTPLKDASYLTNGYLDTIIDWIPGMKGIRLKDLPSFVQTTDPDDWAFNFSMKDAQRSSEASANIIHTFEELEPDLVSCLSSMIPNVYTVGPLQLLLDQISHKEHLDSIGFSLWKEEPLCLAWLNSKEPNSVLYVNFGCVVIMSPQKLAEFGWGLANSNRYFLWIIRPDMVEGESAILTPEFLEVIKDRGFIASWCPQEQVLNHPSIGGFFTHGGWNSTIESLSAGVPMICLPFWGDQQINCRYICKEWEVGMEIDSDFKREDVEKLVRELMEGEKSEKVKNRSMKWKQMAQKATAIDGSSSLCLDKLVKKITFSFGD